MPRPRKRLVSLDATPYYHCISRCVRRAFLCGQDVATGFDFEHRRGWIVDRLKLLTDVFAIDLCAYAVMSNHYHLVLRVDRARSTDWTSREVAERWTRLFKGPLLVQRWLAGTPLATAERRRVETWCEEWRARLHDLSWFMRCLNEPIARMANREDHCTGRFWEGRFTSQALLDERALLACMAYVDLNPIRAAMAKTPEDSEFTSIRERIRNPMAPHLRPFSETRDDDHGIPFRLVDYLELVDWAGRAVRPDKKGAIPDGSPPILERLGCEAASLLQFLGQSDPRPPVAIGPVNRLRDFAASVGARFLWGVQLGKTLCPDRP